MCSIRRVDRREWDALAQEYVHRRNYTPGTREVYALSLRGVADWFASEGIDPREATTSDLLSYRQSLATRYSANTVNSRFKHVRLFYEWMARRGEVPFNPIGHFQIAERVRSDRNIVSLSGLASMWEAAEPGPERVIVGLLGVCALRRDELRLARIEDLHERDGALALSVPSRTGLNDMGYIAIPAQVGEEVARYVGSRRHGFLLSTSRSQGMVAKTYLSRIVKKVSERAGLGSSVSTLSLSYALRSIAIDYSFSYVSVMRSVPASSPLTIHDLVRNAHLPTREQATIRLGRMLDAQRSEDALMALRAELLLSDRSQHPAVAVMVAAATLERALREVAKEHNITVNKKDPTLGTYADALRGENVISLAQLRTVMRILGIRNDAAHGWFDKVSRADAEWVVKDTTELVRVVRAAAR